MDWCCDKCLGDDGHPQVLMIIRNYYDKSYVLSELKCPKCWKKYIEVYGKIGDNR